MTIPTALRGAMKSVADALSSRGLFGGSGQADTAAVLMPTDADAETTIQIRRHLGAVTFAGGRPMDRIAKLSRGFATRLVEEIDRSLSAQESYGEFEARIAGRVGLPSTTAGAGPLRAMLDGVTQDLRVAWNQSLATQEQPQMVPIWRSVLDTRTTPVCWNNHGRSISTLRSTPPEHWGCRCSVMQIPDPKSAGDWGKMGREILDTMTLERESGHATAMESVAPAPWDMGRRSRLFREVWT